MPPSLCVWLDIRLISKMICPNSQNGWSFLNYKDCKIQTLFYSYCCLGK
ncbi:hypothetical protein [Moraxella lacunata]